MFIYRIEHNKIVSHLKIKPNYTISMYTIA